MNSEEKILKMAKELTIPKGKDKTEVLEAIFSNQSVVSTKKINIWSYLQAVAAVLLLLVGLYSVSMVFSSEKIKTGYGEQTNLTLPDGSQVSLNAGSKLIWKERKFAASRMVTLDGEAYFDVTKGNSFDIKTRNGNVKILGTQLNVFSRQNEFRVSCITGKVEVNAGNETVVLLPGESAELTKTGLKKSGLAIVAQVSAWKEGMFYFEDKPLVSIFGEIERQFDVKVKFDGRLNRTITVTFTNKKLEEALDVVCIPMGLKYEIDKNKNVRIFENP